MDISVTASEPSSLRVCLTPTTDKYSYLSGEKALSLATSCPDPIQFLEDHYKHWKSISAEKVYQFLSSEELLSDPRVIDLLSRGLKDSLTAEKVVPLLLQALNCTETGERALGVLKEAIERNSARGIGGGYVDPETLKVIAKNLKPYAEDEGVKDLLELILSRVKGTAAIIAHIALGHARPYQDFYLSQSMAKRRELCNEAAAKCGISYSLSVDNGEVIISTPANEQDYLTLWRSLWDIHCGILVGHPEKKPSEEGIQSIRMKFLVDDKNYFHGKILKMAKEHPDPVRFLLDHKVYWSFRAKKIVTFLTRPENIEHDGVFDHLKSYCDNCDQGDYKTREKAIKGLGVLLGNPVFKEQAKTCLLHLAKFDGYYFTSYHRLRFVACQALTPVIHDPEVKAALTAVAASDPRVPLRGKVQTIIDEYDFQTQELNDEILKKVIQTFDLSALSHEEAINLEYVLWSNTPHSAQALLGLGETGITSLYCSKLSEKTPEIKTTGFHGLTPLGGFSVEISSTAAYYSILKFIAAHTTNFEIFNKIVNTLVDATAEKKLGRLEPLGVVLTHLRENTAFDLPEEFAHLAKTSLQGIEKKLGSSFPSLLSRQKQWDVWKQKEANATLQIIRSNETPEMTRVLALRHSQKYLFAGREYGWTQREYAGYAKNIWPEIEFLANQDDTPSTLRKEAARMLSWRKK